MSEEAWVEQFRDFLAHPGCSPPYEDESAIEWRPRNSASLTYSRTLYNNISPSLSLSLSIYIYIYTPFQWCVCMYMYVYVYVFERPSSGLPGAPCKSRHTASFRIGRGAHRASSNFRTVSGFHSWHWQYILACAAPVTTSDQNGENICHESPTYIHAPLRAHFAAPGALCHDIFLPPGINTTYCTIMYYTMLSSYTTLHYTILHYAMLH